MRSVYYQSVGNPVQNDRLPSSRPTIQMLAPSLTLEEKINSMLGFALLAAALIISVYAFLADQLTQSSLNQGGLDSAKENSL